MTPEIKREFDNLKRKIADLEKQVEKGRINTIMNNIDDVNTYRAVQRALITNSLSIGNGGQTSPEESSLLTLNARNKGFLPPRTDDISIISNPVEGMVTYAYDYEALMVYNGQAWGQTLPRMTNSQMEAITTPLDGQIVYNTTYDAVMTYNLGTSWGMVLPSMTTTQRDDLAAPVEGQIIFNDTTNKINFYTGTAWEAVTSA